MLNTYLDGKYNLPESYVIGDRISDIQLAQNIDAKGILLNPKIETKFDKKDPCAANWQLENYL